MSIVIKDNQRYKQYKDRLRRLCNLTKCNYQSTATGFCKKHNVKQGERICDKCLCVHTDTADNQCKNCRDKEKRQSPDYTSEIVYQNGIRYVVYPNAGKRKMCKIEDCPRVSCGDYCRKHKDQEIKDNQKQCHRCLTVKDTEMFIDDNKEYENCKPCRQHKRDNSLKRHDKRRKFVLQLKINMGGRCVDCGTQDLEVLEFDHVGDDKVNVVRRIYNYEGMREEADKCVLRCCTCHLIKTKDTIVTQDIDETIDNPQVRSQRKNRQRAREFVDNIKSTSDGCQECGWYDINNLQVLHFDHIDSADKEHNISRLVSTGRKLELIQAEINKCRILCGNCHIKRTLRQFNYPVLQLIQKIKEV
jgi:hypothetical protein